MANNMISLIYFLLSVAVIQAMKVTGPRSPCTVVRSQLRRGVRAWSLVAGTVVASGATLGNPTNAFAVQGSIKASTLDESKTAVREIEKVLTGIESVNGLADKKDFQAIADILASPPFLKFDEYCQTLVRSEVVSAEDKVSLGTIKRYGTVADAIIMIGGLGAELKSGGYVIPGGNNNANDIGEEEDDLDSEPKTVNVPEVKRYAKLAAGSLQEILRIGNPILKK